MTSDAERLVLDHLWLADAAVRHHRGRWFTRTPLDDLTQVARLALIRAALRQNDHLGAFADYAYVTMLGALLNYERDLAGVVRPTRGHAWPEVKSIDDDDWVDPGKVEPGYAAAELRVALVQELRRVPAHDRSVVVHRLEMGQQSAADRFGYSSQHVGRVCRRALRPLFADRPLLRREGRG